MARSKSKFKAYALVAGLIGAGAYFHENLTELFHKAKAAIGMK